MNESKYKLGEKVTYTSIVTFTVGSVWYNEKTDQWVYGNVHGTGIPFWENQLTPYVELTPEQKLDAIAKNIDVIMKPDAEPDDEYEGTCKECYDRCENPCDTCYEYNDKCDDCDVCEKIYGFCNSCTDLLVEEWQRYKKFSAGDEVLYYGKKATINMIHMRDEYEVAYGLIEDGVAISIWVYPNEVTDIAVNNYAAGFSDGQKETNSHKVERKYGERENYC